MKKIYKITLLLFVCLIVLTGCGNNETTSEPEATRLSVNRKKVEKELSSFSTTLLDKAPNRVNNVTITCGKINELVVPPR
jgi:vancomycin resistance protein YoaR